MGSAGKIFSDSWQKPLSKAAAAQPQAPGARETPAQAERGSLNAEQEHTHCPSCPHCESLAHLGEKELKALGADRIAACQPTKKCSSVARFVDHTLLKPNATQEEVAKLCEEAKAYCFASVCVNPSYVPFCAKKLSGSGVKVCTVVGFPLGSTTATVKSIEARDAIANGADEIDMVINVGALKSGNDSAVYDDIRAVREATRGKVLKVILETALLSQEEKVRACLLAKRAGADFVKTSTGFGGGGATAEDVRLMRETVGPLMGVKASGGIRDAASAQKMIEAGATRLGTSASVAIVTDAKVEGKGY
ncbi:MAG: deoxyribose-phosphate aldolase [Elusimicrobia bacterium]|nr:deoxyribose-phosphate aldolase [Elusimicrobiota bacterium]